MRTIELTATRTRHDPNRNHPCFHDDTTSPLRCKHEFTSYMTPEMTLTALLRRDTVAWMKPGRIRLSATLITPQGTFSDGLAHVDRATR